MGSPLRVLAVGVAVAGLIGCAPAAPAPPASLAPVVLGQRPIRPVPAFGAVWIANAADGTVTRVDASTGAIVATIRVGDPQRLLAAGCAPSSEHAYATGSFGLRACDSPSAVAAGAGAIWATANDANALARIDPARNAATGTIPLGFDPWSVVASDDAVWVSDYVDDAVVRIDPRALKVIARIPVPAGPTELALAPDTLWVVSSAAGVVTRIDTRRDAVLATIDAGPWVLAISVAGDDVWVCGGSTRIGGLTRIDARSNTAIATYQACSPQGREGVSSIAATDRGLWMPGVTLDLFDRATATVIRSEPLPSYSVAIDGQWLWVLDVFGRLRRVAP